MNLSLKQRVGWCFILAATVILLITLVVFHSLDKLRKDFKKSSFNFEQKSLYIKNLRRPVATLTDYRERTLKRTPPSNLHQNLLSLIRNFNDQLKNLDAIEGNPEAKKIIGAIFSSLRSLEISSPKMASSAGQWRERRHEFRQTINRILKNFSNLQDIQYSESLQMKKSINDQIETIKNKMMTLLLIGLVSSAFLGLVLPMQIHLPFKKIKYVLRELQNGNFDATIYHSQDDEIGEIAHEINKMIQEVKYFNELSNDRISVEGRKFNALANLVKRPVLVSSAENKLIYMSNQTYSLLQVQSEDVIEKEMTDVHIPSCIVEAFELAIQRRSKIENFEISIFSKHPEKEETEVNSELVFKGYANVIPIRGKESSLDYYLMVLSKEMFT